jgi:sugar/nucleoside kinase (ribokinase family)
LGTKREPLKGLADFLAQSQLKRIKERVTLLPDLFADQIVTIPNTPSNFLSEAMAIVSRGGGNYTGVNTNLTRGGCAANCAAALSALEVPTSLITSTSELGLNLIKLTSNQNYLDLSHVKTDGRLAATVAIETREKGQVFNIMISDPGSVSNFATHSLNPTDYAALKNSTIVGLFSWNLVEKGTELIEGVAGFCHQKHVPTYLDLGDPVPRLQKLSELIDKVLRRGLINYLSVNENELRAVSKCLSIRGFRYGLLPDLAKKVSKELPVELDLHTPDYSGLITRKDSILSPAFDVNVRRSTGAGDAWNAGNMFSLLYGARPHIRVLMANLLAGAYVSARQPEIHSLKYLTEFLKKTSLKHIENLS